MAQYKLLLPKMGESVAEATIIKWTKNPGDYIEIDETVMEIATDKVDSDVPSPVAGKLIECLYKDNDVVQVGAVIAIIETSAPEETKEPEQHNIPQEQTVAETVTAISVESVQTHEPEIKQPVFEEQHREFIPAVPYTEELTHQNIALADDNPVKNSTRFYSPLVKNIAAQEGINNAELDQIPGTGAEGRLTKDDLLAYIQNRFKSATVQNVAETPVSQSAEQTVSVEKPVEEALSPVAAKAPETITTQSSPSVTETKDEPIKQASVESKPVSTGTSLSGGDEIIEMDRMRRLIADHMVMSKHTSPHVTSFVEADVTNLVLWREAIKNSFEKREGEKITFTPIFIEAVVRAIKDMPMINISVNGTQIIKKKDINISMATALPNGNLIVPVIKKADELNLVGLTKAVNDLASRARNNKLKPDDVQGGTFTITNVGSFGNVMGTPIINQPQVAILAVGAIKKKPAVIETLQGDMIGIRHMMFLSLSYDHRVVDGSLGGSFVRRVADYLENWDPGREI